MCARVLGEAMYHNNGVTSKFKTKSLKALLQTQILKLRKKFSDRKQRHFITFEIMQIHSALLLRMMLLRYDRL